MYLYTHLYIPIYSWILHSEQALIDEFLAEGILAAPEAEQLLEEIQEVCV